MSRRLQQLSCHFFLSASCLLFLLVSAARSAPVPLASDYHDMRGVNYIPSYTASSVEMWNSYHPARIDDELGYLVGMGVNTVRIFMNVWGWVADPARHEAAFGHFLATASSHGIHVMPVIFDSFGAEPSSDTPWEELSPPYWVKTPGTDWLQPPDFHVYGDGYLNRLTAVAANYDSLLMWDVMNEPSGPGVDDFVSHYAHLLRQLDPLTPITIGAAHPAFNNAHYNEVDVVSYHPYGIFAENVAHYTAIARQIAKGKPLVASEIAYPGAAQPYNEALDHITDENVGFCLFQGLIGDNVNHPFRFEAGFFYVDGEIRDQESYDAFTAVTQAQGGAFGGPPAVKPSSDPLWLPQQHVVEGFGETEVAALLSDFDGVYGTAPYPLLDPTSHMLYRTALAWSFISFTWAEQATAQEIDQSFDLGRDYDERVAVGDYVGAELVLRDWVGLGKVVFERMRPPAAVPTLGALGLTGLATLLLGLGAMFSQTRR